jgi:hypothetical protein
MPIKKVPSSQCPKLKAGHHHWLRHGRPDHGPAPQNAPHRVIYEIRETHSTIGGAINLTCNGLRIFYKVGIYNALEEHCAETQVGIVIVNGPCIPRASKR